MNVTWQETIQHIKADIKRRLILDQQPVELLYAITALVKPGVMVVMIYRLSRFCHYHRLRALCKVFSLMTQLINTSEVSPLADIAGGFVIADAGAIGIPAATTIGKNCTFMGLNSITLGAMQHEPGPDDRIIIGDHCVLGTFSRVMRPVSLANGTQVKPCSVVISSVKKEGQSLVGVPARRKQQTDYEAIKRWNPLKGCLLMEAV